jgi:hypothetical protein
MPHLSVLKHNTGMAIRVSTIVLATGWTLLVGFGAAGCSGKTYTCAGNPNPCKLLTPGQCDKAEGCHPIAASCEPAAFDCIGVSDAGCHGLTCFFTEGTCRPICQKFTTQSQCEGTSVACFWIDGACTTKCQQNQTETDCSRGTNCAWYACEGTPKSCEQYPGDQCPTWLGCEQIAHYPYSTQ